MTKKFDSRDKISFPHHDDDGVRGYTALPLAIASRTLSGESIDDPDKAPKQPSKNEPLAMPPMPIPLRDVANLEAYHTCELVSVAVTHGGRTQEITLRFPDGLTARGTHTEVFRAAWELNPQNPYRPARNVALSVRLLELYIKAKELAAVDPTRKAHQNRVARRKLTCERDKLVARISALVADLTAADVTELLNPTTIWALMTTTDGEAKQ
jgi:hypothetical protein